MILKLLHTYMAMDISHLALLNVYDCITQLLNYKEHLSFVLLLVAVNQCWMKAQLNEISGSDTEIGADKRKTIISAIIGFSLIIRIFVQGICGVAVIKRKHFFFI